MARELFEKLPPNERRELLGELLGQLSVDERLSGLSAADRLSGLSAEQIEAYLNELRKQAPSHGDAEARN